MTEEVKQEQKVETMSHRQLSAKLKKLSNRTYVGEKGFVMNGVDFGDRKSKNRAGLVNAQATILDIVLNNTKIANVFEYDNNGNPKRFARKDQIGPGKLNSFPR